VSASVHRDLLVLLAIHFACAVLGLSAMLQVMTHHVVSAAKRILDLPEFLYYAIADGIKAILTRYPGTPVPESVPKNTQLALFPPYG
jgi:hypothetical protein